MDELKIENYEQILLNLDPKSLQNACNSDKLFNYICRKENDYFWKRKVLIDFDYRVKFPEMRWKDMYIALNQNRIITVAVKLVMQVDFHSEEFGDLEPQIVDGEFREDEINSYDNYFREGVEEFIEYYYDNYMQDDRFRYELNEDYILECDYINGYYIVNFLVEGDKKQIGYKESFDEIESSLAEFIGLALIDRSENVLDYGPIEVEENGIAENIKYQIKQKSLREMTTMDDLPEEGEYYFVRLNTLH